MDKTKNYLIEEVNRNDLMNKNHKNVCTTVKLYWTLSCFISAITECVSISSFAS